MHHSEQRALTRRLLDLKKARRNENHGKAIVIPSSTYLDPDRHEAERELITAADDKCFGALGAIYRHLGNNVKVGVGYSLSDFSDDLTDQSYSSHGPSLNILGKF